MLYNHLFGVHLTCACIATSQSTYDRIDDMIAVALQLGKIVLQDRVLPHAGIHGGRNQFGCAGGQHGGGKHVVADAVSQFADDICCTGSHNKQIAALGQRYVFNIEREVAVEGIHDALIVGKRFERHGRNKLGGVLRHNHMHIGMQLNEHRSQIGALVGSNTARNAQYDGLSRQHITLFTIHYSLFTLTVQPAGRASRSWLCEPACCAHLQTAQLACVRGPPRESSWRRP